MKKIIIALAVIATISGCGGGNTIQGVSTGDFVYKGAPTDNFINNMMRAGNICKQGNHYIGGRSITVYRCNYGMGRYYPKYTIYAENGKVTDWSSY